MIRNLIALGYKVAAMKPVASGCAVTYEGLRSDDALKLSAASNVDASYEEVNPYAFEPAIAPHLAAQETCTEVSLEKIERRFNTLSDKADWVVVEGVGGWQVPLAKNISVADLALELGGRVILVVGIRLGCINHALLSVESIQNKGALLGAWIANRCYQNTERVEENIATLDTLIDAPRLATVPFLHTDQQINRIHFDLDALNLLS